jgi:hypothetical protein
VRRSDLRLLLVPNFEELPFGEENPNTGDPTQCEQSP